MWLPQRESRWQATPDRSNKDRLRIALRKPVSELKCELSKFPLEAPSKCLSRNVRLPNQTMDGCSELREVLMRTLLIAPSTFAPTHIFREDSSHNSSHKVLTESDFNQKIIES